MHLLRYLSVIVPLMGLSTSANSEPVSVPNQYVVRLTANMPQAQFDNILTTVRTTLGNAGQFGYEVSHITKLTKKCRLYGKKNIGSEPISPRNLAQLPSSRMYWPRVVFMIERFLLLSTVCQYIAMAHSANLSHQYNFHDFQGFSFEAPATVVEAVRAIPGVSPRLLPKNFIRG